MTTAMHEITETNGIGGAPEGADLLIFDGIEREWLIGHFRQLEGDTFAAAIACRAREADERLADAQPLPIVADPRAWALEPHNPPWL